MIKYILLLLLLFTLILFLSYKLLLFYFYQIKYYNIIKHIKYNGLLILNIFKSKYKNHQIKYNKYIIPIDNVISQFKKCNITHNYKNTSVTDNGIILEMCLTSNINILTYVLCHELAHMTLSEDKNEHDLLVFWNIMNLYIKIAKENKILYDIKKGTKYCTYTL